MEDDEEEEYLKANLAIVLVFDIIVMAILGDYDSSFTVDNQKAKLLEMEATQPGAKLTKETVRVMQESIELELVDGENDISFNIMAKSARVLEDDLNEWNLGFDEDPKIVGVSV